MKQRIQGVFIGVIATVMLFGMVTVVAAATRSIEATYGVSVFVDGVRQHFAADMQPFTSEGRTFLSVRGVADSLGLDVEWVGATRTVYLNTPSIIPAPIPVPTPTPVPIPTPLPPVSFNTTAPPFETGGATTSRPTTRGSVTMAGMAYGDAFVFQRVPDMWPNRPQYSVHNLNGQFVRFTAYLGRVDGTDVHPATITFFGDGRLLGSFTVGEQDMPRSIEVDVTGVVQFRIEALGATPNPWSRSPDIALANALLIK